MTLKQVKCFEIIKNKKINLISLTICCVFLNIFECVCFFRFLFKSKTCNFVYLKFEIFCIKHAQNLIYKYYEKLGKL